jgi:hypothetical protein
VKDPFHPTHEEIERWARTPGELYPVEDWDIIIADDENSDLFLRLAGDPTCVNHDGVLGLLYAYAGQVVRIGAAERIAKLKELVERAKTFDLDGVQLWASRATAAIAGTGPDPRPRARREDYEFWFCGGWRRS